MTAEQQAEINPHEVKYNEMKDKLEEMIQKGSPQEHIQAQLAGTMAALDAFTMSHGGIWYPEDPNCKFDRIHGKDLCTYHGWNHS